MTDRKRQEAEVRASRSRIVAATDAARRRLERNLHDGAQQRLAALSLSLRLAESRLPDEAEKAMEILAGARVELTQALEELRELARGLHPNVLTDRGLGPALESLVIRSPIPVEIDVPDERFPPAIEAAAYYVAAEALANVAKYADATLAEVRVAEDEEAGAIVVEVVDDGVGGADPARGSGLEGLVDRVESLDGTFAVESPPGGGTRIRATIPTAPARGAALDGRSARRPGARRTRRLHPHGRASDRHRHLPLRRRRGLDEARPEHRLRLLGPDRGRPAAPAGGDRRRRSGAEVDATGDELSAVFGEVEPALRSALAGQARIRDHGWPEGAVVKVRMGLHTGVPQLGEEGYTGLDVIRASRIAAAGHGGQILLSSTAAPFVTGVETRDLGTHRLQGLPDPERIHQVIADGLPRDFPPLRGTVSQLGDARRVVLADDSVLLREGVARLLEEAGFEVVAQSGTADDLLRHVAMHKPDVAVVDIRMPPTHTDEGLRPHARSASGIPASASCSSRSTSSRATRWRCSRRAPRASATSSRTASPTSSSSARRCAGSPTAAPRSTPPSSASSSAASAATTRSSSSPRASGRCSS